MELRVKMISSDGLTANEACGELERHLGQVEGLDTSRERVDERAMDAGTLLLLVLGTPAAVALASTAGKEIGRALADVAKLYAGKVDVVVQSDGRTYKVSGRAEVVLRSLKALVHAESDHGDEGPGVG